jgi:hypothetical protein
MHLEVVSFDISSDGLQVNYSCIWVRSEPVKPTEKSPSASG